MKIVVIKGKIILLAAIVAALAAVAVKVSVPAATKPVRDLPIYSVDRSDNVISITFDCAWNDDDIDEIIKILAENSCPSTFFVVGDWAEKYPDAVKKLSQAGHEIANHSYNHKLYSKLSKAEMIADMDRCDNVIESLTGKKTNLFRPPSGDYNSTVVKACRETGRFAIQWDVDSLDWKKLTTDEIVERVVSKTKSGSIVLLHNGTPNTAQALKIILPALSQKGFKFAKVSDIIYKEGYVIDHAGRQILAQ